MDYEKKYNEALNWMRELYPGLHGATKEDAEHYFPELCESEEEGIRKEIVEYFKSYSGGDNVSIKFPKWIAYLEKLVEQKYLYYDQGFIEGMRQSKSLANAEIIVSPPKITNKVSVSEELYECIRETCACIDDALSSDKLCDMTDYLEMADSSAQKAFDMVEKSVVKLPAEWSEDIIQKAVKEVGLTQHQIDWFKTNVFPPKQEWGEEDEKRYISCLQRLGTGNPDQPETINSKWFKEHVYSRPHWKPSEQEKGALRTAIHVLTEERSFPKAASHLQAILDAFDGKKARKEWKPTEEQMKALSWLVEYVAPSEKYIVLIKNLYDDLKKLM